METTFTPALVPLTAIMLQLKLLPSKILLAKPGGRGALLIPAPAIQAGAAAVITAAVRTALAN